MDLKWKIDSLQQDIARKMRNISFYGYEVPVFSFFFNVLYRNNVFKGKFYHFYHERF